GDDSDRSSGYVGVDEDNTEATCLETTEQGESAGAAVETPSRRRSAPSALQEPLHKDKDKDKGSRILVDITGVFAFFNRRQAATATTFARSATSAPTARSGITSESNLTSSSITPLHSTTVRSVSFFDGSLQPPTSKSAPAATPFIKPRSAIVRSASSPDGHPQAPASRSAPTVKSIFPPPSTAGQSSTSTARLGPGTGVGLTADVFNILNPHSCQSPRKSHGFGHRPASGKTIAKSSRARTSNRFAPLSMRPVTVQPTEVPLSMQSKIIATTAQGSGPSPDFSSDDEAEREARQAANLDDRQSYIPLLYGNQAHPRYFHPRGKKAAKKYGLPIVYDKGAQERYKLLNPSPLTPELTTPESSVT
ncbi:hypothetical protein BGX29_003486, partial [Mortierella sp. GBA35]